MRNAALYFPRIRQPDPLRGGADRRRSPPCGAVAGIIARTDAHPRRLEGARPGIDAGLAGVVGLTVAADRRRERPAQPARASTACAPSRRRPVVWGARTLRGADLLADE